MDARKKTVSTKIDQRQIVGKEHYGRAYNSLQRWILYWYQISDVLDLNPTKFLEVGVGSGVVSSLLKAKGISVTTCDIDGSLNPDVVGSVLSLPFYDGQFDLVLCGEVLEHIPFDDFYHALKELSRICSGRLVISLPYPRLGFSLGVALGLPKVPIVNIPLRIPLFFIKNRFERNLHYWEVGRRGCPTLNDIRRTMEEAGFIIKSGKVPLLSMYYYVFVLEKNEKTTIKG
jgi:Methyltransferase domain